MYFTKITNRSKAEIPEKPGMNRDGVYFYKKRAAEKKNFRK